MIIDIYLTKNLSVIAAKEIFYKVFNIDFIICLFEAFWKKISSSTLSSFRLTNGGLECLSNKFSNVQFSHSKRKLYKIY